MKKFVSMAMVAAMTTSMVPATAFAGDSIDATAKVVNAWTVKDSDNKEVKDDGVKTSAPELQIKITDASTQGTNPDGLYRFTVELDGADFNVVNTGDSKDVLDGDDIAVLEAGLKVNLAKDGTVAATPETVTYSYELVDAGTADGYLEEIYEHLKEIQAGVPTELPEGLESIVYSTSDITSATTEQDKMTLSDFTTTYTGLDTPSTATTTYTGAQVVEEVVDAYAADLVADSVISFTNGYGDYAAQAQLQNGETVDGYNLIDSTDSNEINWVKKSAVLAWAKENGYEDFVNGDDFATSVTAANETFQDWINASNQATLKANFVDGNFYEETVEGNGDGVAGSGAGRADIQAFVSDWKENDLEEIEIAIYCGENGETLQNGDIITLDLNSVREKAKNAYVSVKSDDLNISNAGEDLVYVTVEDEGITASIKTLGTVAEEEKAKLAKDLILKSTVGNFAAGQVIELKLSNGFEFAAVGNGDGYTYDLKKVDDDTVKVEVLNAVDKIEIDADALEIEAVSAKSGAVATIKVKATAKDMAGNKVANAFNATASVEAMKVVDYKVLMSVDADDDVPVIYSGVNVANYGITDDSDHMSLEVTVEESFPGAWSMRKGFNFELPDGVYVTDVKMKEADNFYVNGNVTTGAGEVSKDEVRDAFWNAYQNGDHKAFEFDKRVFDDVNAALAEDEATMTFQLELVADPGFVGDVNLKLTGDLVDEQEVTIAKFATPFVVKAEQNDLKIDYRYTAIPTNITITETEAGLWDEGKATFAFYIEGNHMTFEDDPKFEATGGMELKDDEIKKMSKLTGKADDDYEVLTFTVDEESDEAATVTISGMELYMERNIPAGPYDLEIGTSMGMKYNQEVLFAPDANNTVVTVGNTGENAPAKPFAKLVDDKDYIIDDVADFSTTVKEAFINVVTAGREQDDASFTTKVVVPVGESYIVAGETQVTLDVPAYVSAAGYTMLPVRAVATALGINNNNVIWNGETKTVTILYGQRIITMVAGQKTVNVNGSVIPASAAVEIVDGRTFLPMRDLATALGVTDITWDAATKTATLNGNA